MENSPSTVTTSAKNQKRKRAILLCVLLVICFAISFWGFSYRNINSNNRVIASLTEYQKTSVALSTSMAGATFAITLLPDDTGTAIAEEMMDLTSYVFWAQELSSLKNIC